jgi:hypothetical protein
MLLYFSESCGFVLRLVFCTLATDATITRRENLYGFVLVLNAAHERRKAIDTLYGELAASEQRRIIMNFIDDKIRDLLQQARAIDAAVAAAAISAAGGVVMLTAAHLDARATLYCGFTVTGGLIDQLTQQQLRTLAEWCSVDQNGKKARVVHLLKDKLKITPQRPASTYTPPLPPSFAVLCTVAAADWPQHVVDVLNRIRAHFLRRWVDCANWGARSTAAEEVEGGRGVRGARSLCCCRDRPERVPHHSFCLWGMPGDLAEALHAAKDNAVGAKRAVKAKEAAEKAAAGQRRDRFDADEGAHVDEVVVVDDE